MRWAENREEMRANRNNSTAPRSALYRQTPWVVCGKPQNFAGNSLLVVVLRDTRRSHAAGASRKFTRYCHAFAVVAALRPHYCERRWGLTGETRASSAADSNPFRTTRSEAGSTPFSIACRTWRASLRVAPVVPGYSRDVRRLQHQFIPTCILVRTAGRAGGGSGKAPLGRKRQAAHHAREPIALGVGRLRELRGDPPREHR